MPNQEQKFQLIKMDVKYTIEPVKTSKDEIKSPKLAELGVIPKINSSIIIVGKSGSGKSVLLHNLLTRKEFYNKYEYFDKIILISPTAEQDDVQKSLEIPESCVFTNLDEATVALRKIEEFQEAEIKKKGSAKAKKFCIILDDCVGNKKFMNSPEFISCFIKARHYNATVIFLSQHFKRLPKVCRSQASFLCFFAISNTEAVALSEEFAPPGVTTKDFMRLIDDVLSKPYQFLTINMKDPWPTRFRKGLAETINLDDDRKPSSI